MRNHADNPRDSVCCMKEECRDEADKKCGCYKDMGIVTMFGTKVRAQPELSFMVVLCVVNWKECVSL